MLLTYDAEHSFSRLDAQLSELQQLAVTPRIIQFPLFPPKSHGLIN